jgi:hypothetical protein
MIQNLFRKIVQFNKSQIIFATLLKKYLIDAISKDILKFKFKNKANSILIKFKLIDKVPDIPRPRGALINCLT